MKQYSFLNESAGTGAIIGGTVGAGMGGAGYAFQMWILKYVNECRTAILSSATPDEAVRKVAQIGKTDKILSRRYAVSNYLEERLRIIAATSKDDPDWQDIMYKKVNSIMRNAKVMSILFGAFLTLYGSLAGAMAGEAYDHRGLF